MYIIYHIGADVKTDTRSNSYKQHLYSELTGTIRELTPVDDNGDTDTRFQPPLDPNNENEQAIAEGYRLARTELIYPALLVPIRKETSHDRHKRDSILDNSSQSILSSHTRQISGGLSNDDDDDGSMIVNAAANLVALSLPSMTTIDGSGSEFDSKLLLYISV